MASERHGDPLGCSLCVHLSSQVCLFITMETLSGAFNGGKEVSSLTFLTHTHTHTPTRIPRLFSGAITISERTVGWHDPPHSALTVYFLLPLHSWSFLGQPCPHFQSPLAVRISFLSFFFIFSLSSCTH